MHIMITVKRFQMGLMSLLGASNIRICWRLCLIIIGSCLGWRINSKCWSRRLNKEAYQSHKSSLPKRRNYPKKPRKWPINTVGLSSLTPASAQRTKTPIHSCNLSPKFFQIKKQIDIFMRQWWSSLLKYFRQLLIRVIFLSWRKKLTDCLDLMPLIFRRGHSMKKLGRRSIDACKKLNLRKITKSLLNEWVIDLKYQKRAIDKAILEQKLKSDHCLVD